MNAHTNRCGLSLFVIVGVVVIPWTQQESTTLSFCGMTTKKAMDKSYIIFQENGLFGAKRQTGDIKKCIILTAAYLWLETPTINMPILIGIINK